MTAGSRRGRGAEQSRVRKSLADSVYQVVKREIVENKLAPNEVLVEGALAERFNVSRGPSREALQRLRRTGLVRAVPRLGYVVTPVSLHDFDEIFQMRLALEPVATELATGTLAAGRDNGFRLEELAAAVADAVGEPAELRGARLAQVNADFHREIARLSENRRMERTIGGLIDELERVMHVLSNDPRGLAEVREEHKDLVAVMRRGDDRAAAALMRDQLRNAYTIMRDLVVSAGLAQIDGSGER